MPLWAVTMTAPIAVSRDYTVLYLWQIKVKKSEYHSSLTQSKKFIFRTQCSRGRLIPDKSLWLKTCLFPNSTVMYCFAWFITHGLAFPPKSLPLSWISMNSYGCTWSNFWISHKCIFLWILKARKMMKCFHAEVSYLGFSKSEALVSPSNNYCPSCDESNGISLFSSTSSSVNSAIIINDCPFAYPDCRFGVGIGPSGVIRSL